MWTIETEANSEAEARDKAVEIVYNDIDCLSEIEFITDKVKEIK
jgi:hypothetical protein